MPTEVIKTVKPLGGGDYLTLNAFDAAERRSLTAADEIAVAECYGGGNLVTLGVPLTIGTGWTVNATHYIEYRAAPGLHTDGGPYNTDLPHLEWNIPAAPLSGLLVNLEFFRLKGLQLYSRGGGGRCFEVSLDVPNANYRIEECLIISGGTQVDEFPFAILIQPLTLTSGAGGGVNGRNRVYNNVIWYDSPIGLVEGGGAACFQRGDLTETDFLNNTVIVPTTTPGAQGCIANLEQANGAVLNNRNNYYKLTGTAVAYGGGASAGPNEATSNAEAGDPKNRNIAYDTSNFRNPTAVHTTFNADIPGGSFLAGKGQNTSAFGIARDVKGLTRVLPYSIGAHRSLGGGGSAGGFWQYWRTFQGVRR